MAHIPRLKRPNYQGKRRRSTAGAQGTNTGHEDGEAMASVGVRLTAQLGAGFWTFLLGFILFVPYKPLD